METAYEAKRSKFLTYYLQRYEEIVQEKLIDKGAHTIEALPVVFNQSFPDDQKKRAWRLHPDSINDGKVTCESAALLCAIWYAVISGNASVFVQHLCDRRSEDPHVEVGMYAATDKPSSVITYEAYNSLRKTHPRHGENFSFHWMHWNGRGVGLNQVVTPMNSYNLFMSPRELLSSSLHIYGMPDSKKKYTPTQATK